MMVARDTGGAIDSKLVNEIKMFKPTVDAGEMN